MAGYDIIGDIHGHADELEALLKEMGYQKQGGYYRHPEREVIFLGDFIDSDHPQQAKTLDIVRPMIDSGTAKAVMGNHEFNAICFATEDGKGGYLRNRSDEDNQKQHKYFLAEFPHDSNEYKETIAWFRSLPVYLELDGLDIVHACWCSQSMETLAKTMNSDATLKESAYHSYATKSGAIYDAIETLLKGPELGLPAEVSFKDKYGKTRRSARIRWWSSPELPTSQRLELVGTDLSREQETALNQLSISRDFGSIKKPVFFGHYWMQGTPKPLTDKAACVDFSVARNGNLAAYRWSGEKKLKPENFTWVPASPRKPRQQLIQKPL